MAAVLGLAALADAAPSGPGNALEQASVMSVRPGQTYARTDSGNPGDALETTVTGKTVYVDVK